MTRRSASASVNGIGDSWVPMTDPGAPGIESKRSGPIPGPKDARAVRPAMSGCRRAVRSRTEPNYPLNPTETPSLQAFPRRRTADLAHLYALFVQPRSQKLKPLGDFWSRPK